MTPNITISPPVPVCTSDSDDDSVDTEDALLSLLGLKKESQGLRSVLAMEEEEEAAEDDKRGLLQATPIALPPKCSRYGHSQCTAVTIPDFCTAKECEAILQLARQSVPGFQYITEASHVDPSGATYKVQLQNPNPHKLAVFEDPPTISMIWKRLVQQASLFSAEWMLQYQKRTQSGPPLGLNPRLRVLQYDAHDNDRFEPHFDATTRVGPNQTSRITVLLYLNQDFQGGQTLYLNSRISTQGNHHYKNNNNNTVDTVQITPQTGTLVLFEHDLYHSGAPLLQGTKHVLRTDILFQHKEPDVEQKQQQQQELENDSVSTNDPNTPTPLLLLVRDLCGDLTLAEQTILDEMGLFHSTLEAFLVPGRTLLTQILIEAAIPLPKIQSLLDQAAQHLHQRQSK